MKYKIFVVGPLTNYANWMECDIVDTIEEADLVLFTGGEDVSPSMYGDHTHSTTYYSTSRDNFESKIFEEALKLDKKFIGICRGAQFLCVKSGGKLIQHMNHPSTHLITMYDGSELEVTSSHHQMMYPYNLMPEYTLIGWAEGLSKFHKNGSNEDMKLLDDNKEPEIVYFNNTQSFCIQSHPEWQDINHPTVKRLQELLKYHLEGTLDTYIMKGELV